MSRFKIWWVCPHQEYKLADFQTTETLKFAASRGPATWAAAARWYVASYVLFNQGAILVMSSFSLVDRVRRAFHLSSHDVFRVALRKHGRHRLAGPENVTPTASEVVI